MYIFRLQEKKPFIFNNTHFIYVVCRNRFCLRLHLYYFFPTFSSFFFTLKKRDLKKVHHYLKMPFSFISYCTIGKNNLFFLHLTPIPNTFVNQKKMFFLTYSISTLFRDTSDKNIYNKSIDFLLKKCYFIRSKPSWNERHFIDVITWA